MWFRTFLVVALLAVFSVFAEVDYHVENQTVVIEKALQLEHKGVLKQKANGYLYIDVSDDYIAQILPLIDASGIDAPGRLVPPTHYTSRRGIGAHISVMYENEQIENEVWEVDELGQEFSFSILELRTVKMNRDNRMKKIWLLAVSSPELESLREKYGLSPKLHGHDFHITLCTQVPGQPAVIELEFDDAA